MYIPLLPQKMCDYLHAPVPFIAGIHRSYLDALTVPPQVILVDLDRNEVYTGHDGDTVFPPLPARDKRKLVDSLRKYAGAPPRSSDSKAGGGARGASKLLGVSPSGRCLVGADGAVPSGRPGARPISPDLAHV